MKRRASESLESAKSKVLRTRASEQQEGTANAIEQRSSSEPTQPLSTPETTSANETFDDRKDTDSTSAPTADLSPQTSTKHFANDADGEVPGLNGDKLSDVHVNHDNEINGRKVTPVSQMQHDANNLRASLILLIEIRRLRSGNDNAEKMVAREQAHLERVCQLVGEKDMLVNPYTKLPFNCLIELGNLYETQQKRRGKQAEYNECAKELEQAIEAFEAVLSRRTAIAFEDSDEEISPEIATEIQELISDARIQVQTTQQKLSLLRKVLHESEEGEKGMSELPLRMAEAVLVEKGVISRCEASANESREKKPNTAGNPASNAVELEDRDLEPQEEIYQHGECGREARESNVGSQRRRHRHPPPNSRTREDHDLRPRADGIKKRRRQRSNYGHNPYRDGQRSYDERKFVKVKREQVMAARRALSDVHKQREEVRRCYLADLVAHLQAKAEDDREAAQVEFDQNHFLEQQRFTKEEIMLESENEMFTKQAKELKAFPANEITSDFSDWTGDGYDDSGFEPNCLVWKLEEARITAWVESERDRLGLTAGHLVPMKDGDWDVEEPASDPESKIILPFGDGLDSHDEDLFAGKWRRVIDDYQHKQDKIRAQPKLGTLSWWQVVPGI